MSQEAVLQFFHAVDQNEFLQKKLKSATDPEGFVKSARAYSYNFTLGELQLVIQRQQGELQEISLNATDNFLPENCGASSGSARYLDLDFE